MHRFHASIPTDAVRLALSPEESHHLTRVLRLHAGDRVVVFDGRGHEWDARVGARHDTRVELDIIGPRVAVAEPPVEVVLAIGLLRGTQMDAVVRDATALGAQVIAPVVSRHVDVPRRADNDRALERWRRVALESAKQCRRAFVPEIRPVEPFADVIANGGAETTRIVCVEPRLAAGHDLGERPDMHVTLFVGPEGGWAPEERSAFAAAGAHLLSLGPRTLRAELAPVVALTTLWTRWGWIKEKSAKPATEERR
jgi:16S rRNA (uracil1498-N3)-methyltransferase